MARDSTCRASSTAVQRAHALAANKPCFVALPASCVQLGGLTLSAARRHDTMFMHACMHAGPACEVDVVPACRPSGKPGALPFIGTWLIKSCECWKQLHQADKAKLEDKLFVIQSTIGHVDE